MSSRKSTKQVRDKKHAEQAQDNKSAAQKRRGSGQVMSDPGGRGVSLPAWPERPAVTRKSDPEAGRSDAVKHSSDPLVDRLEKDRDEIARTLADLVEDIRDMRDRLRQGDMETKAEAGRVLSDLRYWLKAARETEAELETLRRKDLGIADTWGMDLEQAKFEVGCRLDRLRECCHEGLFS